MLFLKILVLYTCVLGNYYKQIALNIFFIQERYETWVEIVPYEFDFYTYYRKS